MSASHPATLIIGDIHHQTNLADKALQGVAGAYEKVVFLGDYFDSFFDSPQQMRTTCRWLRSSLAKPDRVHLLGNHDIAYFFAQHRQCRCPGHSTEKQQVFDQEMAGVPPNALQIAALVGEWLLSHAGFSATLARDHSAGEIVRMADSELAHIAPGQESNLLHVGPCRGGHDEVGGPLWLDWSREFHPIAGLNQIVGHTPAKGVVRAKCLTPAGAHRQYELAEPSPRPRMTDLPQPGPDWASVNWCLDCGGVFVGLLEGNKLTPVII
ncbi:MAG TPA: metallophosphoesterase [Candidatus Limnocylindria bacterium]|jgi:hypothetical protein|nr:metallophosphoesterase [Candidatus Limnocylindria bacterium]HTL67238.1 metallophosphoesterase [Lacunisphaera sp.]